MNDDDRAHDNEPPEDHDEWRVPLDFDGTAEAERAVLALPDWVDDLLTFTACAHCGCGLRGRHAVAAGVRRTPANHAAFFAEVACPRCKRPAIYVFDRVPMSVTRFASAMTAAVIGHGRDLFRRAARQTKATEERAALDAMDGHGEFLLKIGLTPEQIDAWATYRKPPHDGGLKENSDPTKE